MLKRLVLFSQPSPDIFKKLKAVLFPEYLTEKIFAYIPSEGDSVEANAKFTPIWQDFAKSCGAKFVFIDNSKRGEEATVEREKLLSANVVMITGGNTFRLLNHLRLSGLDKAIEKLWQKGGVVLAGFSAGAIVLTPSIRIAKTGDINELELKDLTGLGVVDFEVWPHYEETQNDELEKFKREEGAEIKTVRNEEMMVIDK
ncbi:MAG: Type 1 glutamine amidotransferase-like domain-containing protein [Candidatus Shapirobacteria bacterium]|jgi:peptidase E